MEVGLVEPAVHDLEVGADLAARIVPGEQADSAAPSARLVAVAPLDGGDHELGLALEVLVESGLRDAGLGDDRIEADGVEAVAIEELHGDGDEALAPAPGDLGRAEELGGGERRLRGGHGQRSRAEVDLKSTQG